MSKVTIKDKVILVTGANRKRGIGRALVVEAVKRGAKKVYATARNVSQLNDLVLQYPQSVIPLELDVTNSEQIKHIAQQACDTQILINNSGIAGDSGICFNYSEVTTRQEFEVNYFGLLNLTRFFCKAIINNKNGAIVNILSIAGLSPFPQFATYSASKAAAHSLTQSVRAELRSHGVSVFGIYPGPIDTDMSDGLEFDKETSANVAIRVFDGMEQGIEDITTDDFADKFVARLKLDHKDIEKEQSDFVNQMPENFNNT